MSASNYAENKILDHALGVATFTRPANVFLALFTSDPGEAGTGSEVAGLGYARQQTQFNPASNGQSANTSLVTFPAASGGAWGTLTHFGIFDALSAGNLLFSGALAATKVIADTDQLLLDAGSIVVTAD